LGELGNLQLIHEWKMRVLIEIPENYHRQNIHPNHICKSFYFAVCKVKKPKAAGKMQLPFYFFLHELYLLMQILDITKLLYPLFLRKTFSKKLICIFLSSMNSVIDIKI